MLCGLEMYRNLTTTWRQELQKMTMLAGGDRGQGQLPVLLPRRHGGPTGLERLGDVGQAHRQRQADSGERSASANSAIPPPGIRCILQAPGLDVTGVSLPGVPCVIIGHNERIAWGVTNLGFDVQDLYMEKMDPRNGRYVFRGQLEQARLESEWIPVKGARPMEFQQWVTRHGPIAVSDKNRLFSRCAGRPLSPAHSNSRFWRSTARAIGRSSRPL